MSIEEHKRLVADFVRAYYNDRDFERAGTMLAEDFVNHHPGVGIGRHRTIDSFRDVAATLPGFALTVRRMIAEDDQVWTHGVVRTAPDARAAVVVDVWRIRDGVLVEHWDVGQQVPDGVDVDDML